MIIEHVPEVVVYHEGCNDGLCAAAICYQAWGEIPRYMPMHYKRSLPTEVVSGGNCLLFVDFCPEAHELDELVKVWRHIYVIDHHDSRAWISQYKGVTARFDRNHSAAWLTWDEIRRPLNRPEVVDYVQDRDLWQWQLPNSLAVSAAMREWTSYSVAQWNQAMEMTTVAGLSKMIDCGRIILETHDAIAKSAAKRSFRAVLHGIPVRMINCTTLISETCHMILSMFDDVDVAVAFFITDNGGKVQISLRSRPEVRCNDLAAAIDPGGGGHPCAAGATVSIEDFLKMLEVM